MLHRHHCFLFSVFPICYSFSSLKLFNRYDACMDVTDSDHKPVRCKFNVKISHVDRSVRRKEFGVVMTSSEKIRSILEDLCYVPEATSWAIIRCLSIILDYRLAFTSDFIYSLILCTSVCNKQH